MSDYSAEVIWERNGQDFLGGGYSRRHRLRFDGGAEVAGSSSPHVVPEPMSDATAVDPEEAFVAALSSCHMLFFLAIAAARGWVVDRYQDAASGTMAANAEGRQAMTEVTLRPVVEFSAAKKPTQAELEAMHHRAHERCYIANSVRTEVRCLAQTM
jgi:organic hydroperoxide reductase OsmC/OhrA